MGEYASRGPSHAGSTHTSSAGASHAPAATPADRARDAIGSATRQLDFVRRAVTEVGGAHDANDRVRWSEAKHALDQSLKQAERSLERARALETDATPEQQTRLDTAANELATAAANAQAIEPPKGYAAVAHEDELRDALLEPSEDHLHQLLDDLTTTDLRVLRNRIANPASHDSFATTVWGLGASRRTKISDFISNVDRRKARELVAARRRPPPAAAPTPDTLDTKLRRAFDSADVEPALGLIIAGEDGPVRRAIAERFRRYRPGTGDDIAARFTRLDDAVKARIFAELSKEKSRDAVHATPVEPSLVAPPAVMTVPATHVPEPDPRDPLRAFRETKVDPRDDSGWYDAAPTTQATVIQYLAKHEGETWSVVQTALGASTWPGLSPRVTIDDVQFDTVLGSELHDAIGNFSNRRIGELVAPEDLFAALTPMVPADGTGGWNPTIGLVISQHLQRSIVRSVIRMSGRFVDASDAVGLVALPSDLLGRLPLSGPLDRIVAHVLSRTISIAGDAKAVAKSTALLRPVVLHWQGGRLWNVVRTEPANATVEEVAAALGRGNSSDDASAIAAAPPLFSVPAAWALQIEEARANAPVALRRGPVDVGDDGVESRLVALATSSAADELAGAQVGARAQHVAPELLAQTFDESLILLEQLRKLLTPWELGHDVSTETLWTASKRDDLHHASPGRIVEWTAIAPAQRQRLTSILAFATQVDRAATQIDADRRSGSVSKQRSILALLASATATSHLAKTSDIAFAEAVAQQRNESLRSFDLGAANVDATMGQARERLDQEDGPNATKDENGDVVRDTASREQWTPYTQLREQAQDIQKRVAAGQDVDPAELERVELEMEDTNIRQRLHAMQLTLDQLSAERILAAEGLVAHVVATSSFKSLREAIAYLHRSIGEVYIDLELDAKALSTGGASRVGDEVAVRRAAVTRAQTRFESLSKEQDLGHFLQNAAETIHDQQTRTMLVKLGAMILASIAIGAATGGLGLVGVQGALSTVAIEAVGNGAVQYLLSAGERNATSLVEDIGENLFYASMNKFVIGEAIAKGSAMIGPYVELMNRELAAIEVQETRAAIAARKVGGVVSWTVKESVVVSAHAISGMALGATYAHARAAMGGREASAQTIEDFKLQALGVAIGKYVHVAVASNLARYRAQAPLSPKGTPLLEAAIRLEAETREDKPVDATQSLERLRDLAALHEKEIAQLEELDRNPSDHGPSAAERAERRTQLQQQLGEIKSRDMLELQWQVLGIRQLTPEIWTGTASDLDHALSQARAFGFAVELGDQSPEVTHATVNGKALEFHVVSGATPAREAHAAGEQPADTAYGHVWPGERPTIAPREVMQEFEAAGKIYDALATDGYQGAPAARLHWTKHLVEHGIRVDGYVRVGDHEVYATAHPEVKPPTATGLAQVPEMGLRSGNTGAVTLAQCETALDELLANGGLLAKAARAGTTLDVELTDGRIWKIEVVAPRRMADTQVADFEQAHSGDRVWVSDRLTDDQVPRALGSVIGRALQTVGYARVNERVGALEALFAHRATVARQQPTTEGDVRSRSLANAKLEQLGRVDAEIELQMFRMGLYGGDRDAKLAALPPALAAQARLQLEHSQIHFDAAAMARSVEGPVATPRSGLATANVLPDGPTSVRAYGAADYETVLALRVELGIIREIDARTALRDQPGTNRMPELAKGETERRAPHVARARTLLEQLQLGGGDMTYIDARLKELSRVFPGADTELVPAIQGRFDRRAKASAIHDQAEAFRNAEHERVQDIVKLVKDGKPFTTKRVIAGAGMSGLAEIAASGVSEGGHLDPTEVLVVGGDDLLARIDPGFSWGQRAAAYDRDTDAHPAFSADAKGTGSGALQDAVEDPGDFMSVGSLRDAADLARQRLGITSIPFEVHVAETYVEKRTDTEWAADPGKFPVRVWGKLGTDMIYVYCETTKIETGPGNARYPSKEFLTEGDRNSMLETETMVSGDKLLEGRSVANKRALVVAFGPTGAWAARLASDQGAARVDWASMSGGELGAGADDKSIEKGDWHRGKPRKNTPSNDWVYNETMKIDRTQSAADPKANIHTTTDRIVHIDRRGEGAVVTYAHGPAEHAEIYEVTYDVIITTMGYTNEPMKDAGPGAKPTVADMLGDTKMQPKPGTRAPITTDVATGLIEVGGYAVGDAINVSRERAEDRPSDKEVLDQRRQKIARQTSADSPDDLVVEGVGISSRRAHQEKEEGQ